MENNPLLYHITHVANLPSILEQGRLQSHLIIQQHELPYEDVANLDVQSRRKKTKISGGMGGSLHDYIPFYFESRSPMLYSLLYKPNVNQNDMIYFMTNIQTIVDNELPFVFTDAHAIRRLSNVYTDLSNLDKIDWDVMKSAYWNDTNEDMSRKARRQAEFLVYCHVPLSACLGFAVYDKETKEKVEQMLTDVDVDLPVGVRPGFYF
ncbi:toxin-antitoxin system toxin DarT [Lentibacillus halophilus]|uniref:Toxin-antitoxin system toxin DarT n=1 Tax=Lentibacillus halophilus TaxID=295065 RepID=A0ABN0Z0S2_9BACI